MNHLYIQIKILSTEPFLHASAEQIGYWLQLYAYCATQENGGRIQNCRNWAPATWLRIMGRDTPGECSLWVWHDDDLLLIGYDTANERLAQRKREGGKKGSQRRWSINPSGFPHRPS